LMSLDLLLSQINRTRSDFFFFLLVSIGRTDKRKERRKKIMPKTDTTETTSKREALYNGGETRKNTAQNEIRNKRKQQ